jgi:hypothetical protein
MAITTNSSTSVKADELDLDAEKNDERRTMAEQILINVGRDVPPKR